MKKWYRANVVKTLLVVLVVLATGMMTFSLWWYANNLPSLSDIIPNKEVKNYEDTRAFVDDLYTDTNKVLDALQYEKQTTSNEDINEDSYIDLEKSNKEGAFVEAKENGLVYKLGDLLDWQNKFETYYVSDYGIEKKYLMVCAEPSKGYEYLYLNDLAEKVANKELVPEESYKYTTEGDLEDIKNNLMDSSGFVLNDASGKTKYTSFWNYDNFLIDEKYKPRGYDSLIDMVNKDVNWNGRLDEANQLLADTIKGMQNGEDDLLNLKDSFKEGDTNFTYILLDESKNKSYSNVEKYKEAKNFDTTVEKLMSEGKYIFIADSLQDFKSNIKEAKARNWTETLKARFAETKNGKVELFIHIDDKYPISDHYKENATKYQSYLKDSGKYVAQFLIWGIIWLIALIWLCFISGKRKEDEEIHLNGFDKIYTEIAAIVIIGLEVMVFAAVASVLSTVTFLDTTHVSYNENLALMMMLSMAAAFIGIAGLLSLVRRIKAKTLWSGSILKRIVSFIGRVFRHINLLWKWGLAFLGFILLHWIAIGTGGGVLVLIVLILEAMVGVFLAKFLLGQEAIYKGLKEIANGNLEYKIPYKHLRGNQLEIASYVNNLGDGFEKAKELSLKSERMKTDLITNVSHDLKTPLTSIINYVGLLKQESFADSKIEKYLQIIEEKAFRLKNLTEDVVEASKATSGNIKLEMMDLNFAELIRQASGEFSEKLKERNLTEIIELPDKPVIIRADAKVTWRVLENIYTNVTKYAMPGTRVYTKLMVQKEGVIFSLKNISEEELNITPEELTERFIRGDRSRTKEGSGLGLSIAKSLTQMQGGSFRLELDGDLFKVNISFPLAI